MTTTEASIRAMSQYSQFLPAERKAELMLLRIIQEVIINIDKHARASNVFVHLDARDSNIEIVVEDDGIGFDVQSVSKATDRNGTVGFGILGMKERASLLDGKLTICSTIGVGTSVTVGVPLNSLEIKDV